MTSGSGKHIESRVSVGEVSLHVVEEGAGDPVVLLHGFPENWYSWRHQMSALADAGYRAIAPDQRGYGLSDKPPHVSDYRTDKLASDIATLIDRVAGGSAHLVGHDWGGAVAWIVAARYPEKIRSLSILNAPHPSTMLRELRKPEQRRKSWYMLAFQIPLLPERVVQTEGFLAKAMKTVRPGAISAEDFRVFREAMRTPGAARGAVSWYRAAARHPIGPLPMIDVRTQIIWGEQDLALGLGFLDGLDRHVRNLRIERLPGASHWVQQDAPDDVNRLLLAFLRDA